MSTDHTIDPGDALAYLEAVESTKSSDSLAELGRLAELQAKLEEKVSAAEMALKAAEAELREISEGRIPEVMEQLGMKNFTTASGLVVSVGEVIRASIPKDNEPTAFAWLRENGHGGLIKRTVSVLFGRGDDEKASKLITELVDRGLSPENKEGVNANTLAAWVREQLREGKDFPLEMLGVHRQKRAKVEIPSPKGKKGDGGKKPRGTEVSF